jgi:hypothetical protein
VLRRFAIAIAIVLQRGAWAPLPETLREASERKSFAAPSGTHGDFRPSARANDLR